MRAFSASKMSCDVEPDLWPIRPRPLPSEVFSGWMARIAQGHGAEPRVFFGHLRRNFRLSSDRDLDTNPSYELLAGVSQRTAIHYDRLVVMTLRWHVQAWYARHMRNGQAGCFGFCPLHEIVSRMFGGRGGCRGCPALSIECRCVGTVRNAIGP